MPRVPLPSSLAQEVSELAVRHARANLQRRGWSPQSQVALHPSWGRGRVGIRSSLNYLMYQNKGFASFLMSSLEGKTVPIKGQFFKVRNVGQPGWGFQDRKGFSDNGVKWRDQRWKHPGIEPQRFLENSISRALLESRAKIQASIIDEIQRRGRG